MRLRWGLAIGDLQHHSGSVPISTLMDGLSAYWRLEEESGTRVDVIGGNDLTDVNTTGYAVGKKNNAASFAAGNNEYLARGSQVLPVNGDFTLTFWAKHSETDGENRYVFPFKSKATTANQHGIFLETTWGALHRMYNRRGNGTTIELGYNGDVWVLYAYEYVHSTTTTRCMALGSASNSGVWSAGSVSDLGAATDYFDLGGNEASNLVEAFLMDEAALWTRVLTDDEYTELYNSGAGCFLNADATNFEA